MDLVHLPNLALAQVERMSVTLLNLLPATNSDIAEMALPTPRAVQSVSNGQPLRMSVTGPRRFNVATDPSRNPSKRWDLEALASRALAMVGLR